MLVGNSIRGLVITVFLITTLSCDPWFSYSPYAAKLDETYHGTTEKNLALIGALDAGDSKPFKIAVLADPHYHYSKLDDAVSHINGNGEYQFVIVNGDLSENGLMQELVFFHEGMANLKIPYIAVIGNHDYLSNGEKVYSQMYGQYNHTFAFNNVKFVIFDNTTLESEKEPDMTWLAEALVNDGHYDHVIPFAHIPPYDHQMRNHGKAYHELMVQNDISLSVHGHKHDFSLQESFGDGVRYLTVSSPQKRTYTELHVTPDGIDIRKIEY